MNKIMIFPETYRDLFFKTSDNVIHEGMYCEACAADGCRYFEDKNTECGYSNVIDWKYAESDHWLYTEKQS